MSQVALFTMGSAVKDVVASVCLFDRLALRNIRNPIISVDLSYDTSYSFEEQRVLVKKLLTVFGKRVWFVSFICVVPRSVVSQLDVSIFTARLILILDKWLVDCHCFCSAEYGDIVKINSWIIRKTSPQSLSNQLTIPLPLFTLSSVVIMLFWTLLGIVYNLVLSVQMLSMITLSIRTI